MSLRGVAACTSLVLAAVFAPASGLAVDTGGSKAASTKLDDRDLTRKGTWKNVSAPAAFKKTLSRSTDPGAKLKSKVPATGGGKVTVQKGPGRGKIDVLVGGDLKKTITTAAPSTKLTTVKFKGSGKVVLKVRSAGNGVYVDALSLRSPKLGQGVIFTEVLAEPTELIQTGQWFELHNTNTVPIAVSGCTVKNQAGSSTTLPTATLQPGARFVVARTKNTTDNGGLVANATFGFDLRTSTSLRFACAGTTFDVIGWTMRTEGASTSLDPDFYSAAANDDANEASAPWCLGSTPYGTSGDLGTPGALNPQCS